VFAQSWQFGIRGISRRVTTQTELSYAARRRRFRECLVADESRAAFDAALEVPPASDDADEAATAPVRPPAARALTPFLERLRAAPPGARAREALPIAGARRLPARGDAAYMIYTSGSTGVPKAVQIT